MNQLLTLTVESQQLGQKKSLLPNRQFTLPESWGDEPTAVSLRQLIQHIVQAEVSAFHNRQSDQLLFRVLTAKQIATGKKAGRIDPAAKIHRQEIEALYAFQGG